MLYKIKINNENESGMRFYFIPIMNAEKYRGKFFSKDQNNIANKWYQVVYMARNDEPFVLNLKKECTIFHKYYVKASKLFDGYSCKAVLCRNSIWYVPNSFLQPHQPTTPTI